MKLFKKTYWLITPILIVFFMILLEKVFLLEEIRINTTIAVLLAYILSPKITMIEKQHGQVEQIKWLFFKKVLKN
ncbi:MAG: hypothetical protein COZ74_02035 [Flavobacteriaceae bacterium CG_4_8_14_3_um_filter_31_8]|nr:MAG: hypothetical protein AUK46_09180 [Flavobacteriaceae bacterium CG2_30_31_66]PIX14754.1 MAG: hypothetical protein COZ74_02035 [Flavobacteriaceae bacterium CG_4_8_14_3_um_filter_31_8]